MLLRETLQLLEKAAVNLHKLSEGDRPSADLFDKVRQNVENDLMQISAGMYQKIKGD